MLMSLSQFTFAQQSLAPNDINKRLDARWQKQNRYAGRPALQFTGIEGETVNMTGYLYPSSGITGTANHLNTIKDMMLTGTSHVLVGSDGSIYGLFAILSLREVHTYLDKYGNALKIEFEISLERTDNDQITRLDNTQA